MFRQVFPVCLIAWMLTGIACSSSKSPTESEQRPDSDSGSDTGESDSDQSSSDTGESDSDQGSSGDTMDTGSAPHSVAFDCEDSGVFCAASCALEDVQAAADRAMSSDIPDTTVWLPGCEPNPYVWDAGAMLTLATPTEDRFIRLVGSGQEQTSIVNFQIDLPGSGQLNIVELGLMTLDGGGAVSQITDNRLRPMTVDTELYWHDLVIKNYTDNYTLAIEGWHGLISHLSLYCEDNPDGQNPYGIGYHGDGVYDDHTTDFGTRNALFIEESLFDSCSHSISCFCDGYVVFRNNTVVNSDSHTDLHGPGYNYCFFNPEEETAGGGYELYDNEFVSSQGNWVINARAGSGHIITGNRFESDDYQIVLYWDSGSATHGINCGTDPGETCDRCDTLGCEGCCQAQENTFIFDNDGTVIEYVGGGADDCIIENTTYFLRAPNVASDGFDWTPFTFPHPLRSK